MNYRIPVDKFIKRGFRNLQEFRETGKMGTAVSFDEHELYHGFKRDELVDKQKVYYLNKKYPEKIIIMFECEHKGIKQNHHPDYDKPFEIEKLCKHCHYLRHKDNIDEIFNVPFSKNGKRIRDSFKK